MNHTTRALILLLVSAGCHARYGADQRDAAPARAPGGSGGGATATGGGGTPPATGGTGGQGSGARDALAQSDAALDGATEAPPPPEPISDAAPDVAGPNDSAHDGSADAASGPSPATAGLGFQIPADSPPDAPLPPCGRQVPVADDSGLAAALATARPGDCLLLGDGNYRAVKITARGTVEAPIVLRAARRLGAVITSGQLVLERAAFVVLDGLVIRTPNTMKLIDCESCRITRSSFQLGVQDDWLLIHGAASHHNRIDHCELGPKPTPGPFIVLGQEQTMSRHDRIDHNHFHDNGPPAVNEKESVRIGWSGVSQQDGFAIVEHNLFENCDGDPEIVSVKTNQNIVRYNTVRTSAGVLSLRHGNGSWVYGNFILGGRKTLACKDAAGADTTCATGGIRVYGRDHKVFNNYIEGTTGTGHRAPLQIDGGDGTAADAHHQVVNLQVVANTLVDNASGIEIGKNYTTAPKDVIVAYNLIRAPVGKAIVVFKPATTATYLGNLVWTGGEIGAALMPAQARQLDPGLARIGELWKLAAGSPAIDAAGELDRFVTTDVDGQPRTRADVGADELDGVGTGSRRPLTAEDVGPASP